VSDKIVSLGAAFGKAAKAEADRAERFRVETLSQFPKPENPRLVRGFVGHRDLVVVYGGWSAGKSFFAIDLGCCFPFGDAWRDRECDCGAVVYVAGEAPGSIKNRIRARLLRHGKLTRKVPDPAIGVIGCAPNLLNGDGDLDALCRAIEAFQRSAGMPVRVIVIDTVHSCAPGSREDAGDMGAVLANVRELMRRFGCAVVLVHHAGKNAERGARGSNSLEAAADVIVEVVEDGGVRTPIVRKLRDGEPPELQPFEIGSVVFDQDTPDPVRVGVHVLTEPKDEPGDVRKARAAKMRRDGESFAAIARTVGVSKSTAERWCKGRP